MVALDEAASSAATMTSRAAQHFAAYRAGDEQQLGLLVDLLSPLLWHTARGCGLDREEAQDCVQGAWVALIEHLDSIRSPQAVVSWLVTTTRRSAWRLKKLERRTDLDVVEDRADAGPGPDEIVAETGLHEVLWRHFESLDERCRALLRVIAVSDRPDYASLAQAMAMPVGSIGPTRGRCLAKLRNALLADPAFGPEFGAGLGGAW